MATLKLARYRAKRDFKITAEPSDRSKAPKHKGFSYLIQKHAATRLHYDFRLELDGTLKSWAVTRGPSLDPADKRLAVHVEDHPLAYGTFEGTIPQGQYGGGTVMLWDRGTWEPVGDPSRDYAKGRLTFILHGERLKGEWHLVKMSGRAAKHGKNENWLLIKSHDQYAKEGDGDAAIEKYQNSVVTKRKMESIASDDGRQIKKKPVKKAIKTKNVNSPKVFNKKTKLPDFVPPQLATLVSKPPIGKNWVHEIKFDGYRALCRIENGEVRLLTRANNDWTEKFRGLAKELKDLRVESALIDGEVVMLEKDGTMSFHALQQALGKGGKGALDYYMFDILFLNGEDLRRMSLLERKEILRSVIPEGHARLHYSEHFREPGGEVLQHACSIALEGIVSKQTDAPYDEGRSKEWLKSKCINEQEFVIGGFTYQPKHAGALGALLIGYYAKKDLILCGKVGTGFNQEEARALLKKLEPLKIIKSAFKTVTTHYRAGSVWVKPVLAAQVSFSEWTPDGVLRHPSYQGLRTDKPTEQIVREKAVAPPRNSETVKAERYAPPKKSQAKVVVAGVTLSHPDKVLFTDVGVTKLQLAQYYETVADWMLPHVAGRPISLMRCPEGTKRACFFQRHINEGLPKYVKTVPVKINETRDYLYIEDVQGLIALVQMGVLEIHIWGAHVKTVDKPDRLVFDFDPAEGVPWSKVKDAAKDVRTRLKKLGLESFLEATGGKGLHVVLPLIPKTDWDVAKTFARGLAEQMTRDSPDLYTISPRKMERTDKIFIDYLRNGKGASAIAPYSTRNRAGAPVAVPLAWDELGKLANAHPFDMATILQRLQKGKDPWSGFAKVRQVLPMGLE